MQRLTTPTWKEPDSHPELADSEIHVWRSSLVRQNCNQRALSASERERWENFSDPESANRYCATRTWLRALLSRYAHTDPDSLDIQTAQLGKPFLRHPKNCLTFNLSHSGNWLLIAVARAVQVGVDLEVQRDIRNREKIAARVLDADANAELQADNYHPLTFTAHWTRMEAKQKCLGQGVFGRQVGSGGVGLHTFHAGDRLLASLAWAAPEWQPGIKYFIFR